MPEYGPDPATDVTSRRPLGRATLFSLALFLYSAGWLLIGLVHVWEHPIIGWLPMPLLPLLAARACFQVPGEPTLSAPPRRFWRLFGIACALLTAGVFSNM